MLGNSKKSRISSGHIAVLISVIVFFYLIFLGVQKIENKHSSAILSGVDLTVKKTELILDDVTNHNLFGEKIVVEEPEYEEPVYEEPEKVIEPINVVVTGILASNSEKYASATLRVEGGKEKAYRIGQKLKGDEVFLKKIDTTGVVVENNGQEQEFKIAKVLLKSNKRSKDNDLGLLDPSLDPNASSTSKNYSSDADLFSESINEDDPFINDNDDDFLAEELDSLEDEFFDEFDEEIPEDADLPEELEFLN